MSGLVQIGSQPSKPAAPACAPVRRTSAVLWLQGVTLAWMLVECGASLYAAANAHSPALLAFGSDSFVELLSASVVLLQFSSPNPFPNVVRGESMELCFSCLPSLLHPRRCSRWLFACGLRPSLLGMLVTVSALVAMPILAGLKRREARRTNMWLWRPTRFSQPCARTWPLSRWPAWLRMRCSIFHGSIRLLPWLQYRSFSTKDGWPGRGMHADAADRPGRMRIRKINSEIAS